VRSVNEKTVPEELARHIAEVAAQVADLSRRLQLIEGERETTNLAHPTDLTIHSYDDDENAIHFLTENGFVIVRAVGGERCCRAERGSIFVSGAERGRHRSGNPRRHFKSIAEGNCSAHTRTN
jgi:hypothetical protein